MAAESQPCLKLWLFLTASILRAERGITISQPKLLEHNDMKWIKADELAEYEFCPADEEIIRRLRQHRTKTALRLSTTSACSFSVILHKTRLITVRLTTLVLHNLTKKSTAHLRYYLCAVLP